MTIVNKGFAALAFAIAVTAFSAPSFAQGPQRHAFNPENISSARRAALEACSTLAARYPDFTWGDTEIYMYGDCMAAHGQPD